MEVRLDSTTKYARLIVDGEILASKSIIDACNRHLKDMKSQTEYVWDFSYAEKAISFMEMLPDPKTGKTFPLASFQKFIVGNKICTINSRWRNSCLQVNHRCL